MKNIKNKTETVFFSFFLRLYLLCNLCLSPRPRQLSSFDVGFNDLLNNLASTGNRKSATVLASLLLQYGFSLNIDIRQRGDKHRGDLVMTINNKNNENT